MLFFAIDLLLSLRNHAWHLRCVSAHRIASSLSHVFQPWCFGRHACFSRLLRLRAWLTWTSVSVGLRPFHGGCSRGSSSDGDGSDVSATNGHETIHSNRDTSVLGGSMGIPIQSNPDPPPTKRGSKPTQACVSKPSCRGHAPPSVERTGAATRIDGRYMRPTKQARVPNHVRRQPRDWNACEWPWNASLDRAQGMGSTHEPWVDHHRRCIATVGTIGNHHRIQAMRSLLPFHPIPNLHLVLATTEETCVSYRIQRHGCYNVISHERTGNGTRATWLPFRCTWRKRRSFPKTFHEWMIRGPRCGILHNAPMTCIKQNLSRCWMYFVIEGCPFAHHKQYSFLWSTSIWIRPSKGREIHSSEFRYPVRMELK